MSRLSMLMVLPLALGLGCNERQRGESPVPPASPTVGTTANEGDRAGTTGGTLSGPGTRGAASERGTAAPGTPPDRGEDVRGAAGTVGTTRGTREGGVVVDGPIGEPRTGSERTGTPSTPAGPRKTEGGAPGGAYNTRAGSGGVGGVSSGVGGSGSSGGSGGGL